MSQRKRHTRRNSKKQALIGACVSLAVVLIGLLVVAVLLTAGEEVDRKLERWKNVRKELTLEAGDAAPKASDFLKEINEEPAAFVTGVSQEQMRQPGSYDVSFTWGGETFDAVVHVEDTVPPSGTAVNQTSTGALPEASAFVTDVQDVCDVTISYKETPDVTTSGTREVVLVLTDTSGNTAELTAMLTVELDEDAPVISGVEALVIYTGDAVSYRTGITVTDQKDPSPSLKVDSSQVDLSTPGTYVVTYIATDAAGNETRVETTIEVREKQANYVDLEVIYAEADRLLDQIITEGMTKREQVVAIYDWTYEHCWYSDGSDKSDYLQAAYIMMTERQGDCFNYFGMTKLMFERLGIDNIDVRKVKLRETDADHFWSLVSLDNGETWYHFDATPRIGEGDDFCLVTDAFLDAYSEAHDNCHNRDKSLYPATPVN